MPKYRSITLAAAAQCCEESIETLTTWIEGSEISTLPACGERHIHIDDLIHLLKVRNRSVPEALERKKRRVLIVEDDAIIAATIQRAVDATGFESMIAPDGFRAGILLQTWYPDIVTLDLKMPGMHGLEILRFLRQHPELKDIKIVVISAMPQDEINQALEAGAQEVIKKPFRREDIIETISALAE